MKETRKSRAFNAPYESTRQLVLSGFETPFERELDKRNRWVVLSHLIPWDEICEIYLRKVPMSSTGRPAINLKEDCTWFSDYQISLSFG